MRGEVHILVYCPIDTLQWGSTHSAMNRFNEMKKQKLILNIKNYDQLRSFMVNLIQAQVRTLLARNLLKRSTTDWRTAES